MKTKTTAPKTIEQIKKTRADISRLAKNDIIKFSDIGNVEGKQDMSALVFYYFVYANALTMINRGTYRINRSVFYSISDEKVYSLANVVMNKKRELKKLKESATKPNQKNETTQSYAPAKVENWLTEQEAVQFLKSLGYKIMKPVSQYEEV